jgi:hypothetical protein
MTAGRASNTDSEGRIEHIRRELEAAEQRELMFLARERNERMRELTSWLKLDLTAITDKNLIASRCSRDEDVIFHFIISHRNYRHCVRDAGVAGSANEATDGRSCWGFWPG